MNPRDRAPSGRDTFGFGATALLRLEGAALLAAAVAAYAWSGTPWWAFLVLLLAPDLAMIGYLRGPATGSVTYNAVHTTSVPLLLLLATLAAGTAAPAPYLLIWLAHIGLDRAVGYGLKLPSGFQDTHLGRMGAAPTEPRPEP